MSEIKYCETCKVCVKEKGICQRHGIAIPVDLKKDYCSKHVDEIIICEVCRQPMIPPGIIEVDKDGNVHQFCDRCNQLMKTCATCPKVQYCAFDMDPNPMPKVVMQTVQQGNMTMQSQIKNPERIKLFCHSCKCWNEDAGCFREYNIGCIKKPDFWTGR